MIFKPDLFPDCGRIKETDTPKFLFIDYAQILSDSGGLLLTFATALRKIDEIYYCSNK